jgi:hypothetical protein
MAPVVEMIVAFRTAMLPTFPFTPLLDSVIVVVSCGAMNVHPVAPTDSAAARTIDAVTRALT